MSTRSNVLIKMGDTKIYLYRHSDGYPGANGADLAEKLIKHKNHGKAFINDLLAERYDATEYRPERPVWELTNGLHGDIEWLYVFEMADGDFYDIPVLVKVIERAHADPDLDKPWPMIKDEDIEKAKEIGLDGLIEMSNLDRAEMNKFTADNVLKALKTGENLGYANDSVFYDLIKVPEKEELGEVA